MASAVLLLQRIDGEVARIGMVLQAFIKVNAHGGDVNAVLKKIEPCRKTVSFLRIRKTASNLYRE
ncbi:hypothetical protein CFC21_038177 [Triticum aestivum]|uniref:Uncharacterized protein n=4 Tax=Triticum TaxID=4564 RepID=A0A9R0VU58_TRITD|nr:hypothetical protein TRIUR3_21637 [Triticum urartu]KAF7026039.1 hypothetical protein CFC21_038177 [Triticum aestivum]VAH69130.1 unnamed protein product [Triticum turgidum subsp. durum]